MRKGLLVAVLVLAGCSGGESAPKQEEKAAPPAAIPTGQWQAASEVTRFTQADQGKAKIDTPVGTKGEVSACVSDAKQPDPALFVGEGYDCTYQNSYISNGTLNASLECRREGLQGQIMVNVNGSYTADTIEAEVATTSYLVSDGDVQIGTKVTARRTGECAAQ